MREYERISDENIIENAKAMLKEFSLVGFVCEMDRLLNGFANKIGSNFDTGAIKKLNSGYYSQDSVSRNLRNKIEQFDMLDYTLYGWSKSEFECKS